MNIKATHSLIIIGSGPAGLTAGIYASRAFLHPLIFQGSKPGGQLMGTTLIENWPGTTSIMGPQLMIDMQNHAHKSGATILDEIVTTVDFPQRPFLITSSKNTYTAHSVIIATGSSPNKLGCPGEEEYWGKGVTTCAVCDGAFYPQKKVVIVGGGDTAMETASFMAKYTQHITIVHILDKLTASPIMQERVLSNRNITIIYESTISEIKGKQGKVSSVTISHAKTGTIDLDTDALFLAIGNTPNTTLFKDQLRLDKSGHIEVTQKTETSVKGVFVAGDVADYRYKQAIVSAAAGCMAAMDAQRYLELEELI